MEHDFDYTNHPTHQLLGPVETEMIVALVAMTLM